MFTRIMDVSFPCTFVRGNETTTQWTFVPGNERVDVSFPGTKLSSNFRTLERTECQKRITTCNKLKMIFADRKLYYRVILGLKLTAVVLVGLVVVRFFVKLNWQTQSSHYAWNKQNLAELCKSRQYKMQWLWWFYIDLHFKRTR